MKTAEYLQPVQCKRCKRGAAFVSITEDVGVILRHGTLWRTCPASGALSVLMEKFEHEETAEPIKERFIQAAWATIAFHAQSAKEAEAEPTQSPDAPPPIEKQTPTSEDKTNG